VPLNFFHVRLGTMLVHDTEGEVFENLSAAKSGADDRSKRLLRSLQPTKQAEDIRALP
jgi:hypothetical protein